jgi:diamine N-acetyltransferase
MQVSLRQITAETFPAVVGLSVAPEQQDFVATNVYSLAEALFTPEAWYRAIYADETPVGFLMLYDESLRDDPPPEPAAMLWRFMVDQRFQGRGIGRAALEQLIAHVRAKGTSSTLLTSYSPGPGGPEPFYRRFGFRYTGMMEDHEVVLALPLDDGEPWLTEFIRWTGGRDDLVAAALVGSHARGTATPESDVDLVVLTSDPERYVRDTGWAAELGPVSRSAIERFGRVTSVRVWYTDGPEVEYGFAHEDWAAVPADPGTREVVDGGLRVLFERRPLLSLLLERR